MLNYLLLDLITGARSFELFQLPKIQAQAGVPLRSALNRLTINHLILCLCKFEEFYDSYKSVIPADCRDACKLLRNEIRKREFSRIRNEFVGHIRSSRTNRPLSSDDLERYLETATNHDFPKFVKWVNDGANNFFPKTVVSIVEQTRDRLMAVYKIQDREISEWVRRFEDGDE